jgi:hypothetical protein
MGFSSNEWGLFFGLAVFGAVPWMVALTAQFGRFYYGRTYAWRWFFSFVWAALYTLVTFSMFYWLRFEDGRDGSSYEWVGWLHFANLLLNAMWSPLFFGRYYRSRPGGESGWRKFAWFVLLAAVGTALAITILQGIAYGKSGSPSDVTVAFWTYIWYTAWLAVALVWSGLYTWGSWSVDLDRPAAVDEAPLVGPQSALPTGHRRRSGRAMRI